MFEIGRVCVKIAGRDAGKRCVIVDVLDKNNVMIDGDCRRRKCGVRHLEATRQIINLSKGASNSEVVSAMKQAGFDVKEKQSKIKVDKTEKPRRARKTTINAGQTKKNPGRKQF